MADTLKKRFGLAAAVVCAVALGSTPAMAGRCGHSFSVDSPITLAKVARACNVSLSALREANTGVDPNYVAPGEHLAIPDEIAAATDVPAGGANLDVAESYGGTPIYHYAEYSEPSYPNRDDSDAPSPAEPVYVSSSAPTEPYFIRASALGSPLTMREDRNLSYQQLSAARIRNAGVSTFRQTPVMMPPSPQQPAKSVMISTRGDMLYGDPLSPLMECAVLRRRDDGKVAQVREFKPLPEGRETPAHCAEVTNTSFAAPIKLTDKVAVTDFLRTEYEGEPSSPVFTVLEGYVSAADAECITLRADDGMVWRIGVPLAPVEMLGKEATIWAELTDAPQCGGLTMNRAVYAERIH